jgi:hypothetical protein
MLFLLALVFAWLGPRSPTPAPVSSPQASVATIQCGRCAGKRVAEQACLACCGAGRIPCALCNAKTLRRFYAGQDEAKTPARLEAERKASEAAEAAVAMPGSKKMKTRALEPGHLRCPTRCADGLALLGGGHPCLYCAKQGQLACPQCEAKATRACPACAGSGRTERTCEACLGAAVVVDPRSIPAAERNRCPWCLDRIVRPCGDCKDGLAERVCLECFGAQEQTCSDCLGAKRSPCLGCRSTGFKREPGAKKEGPCAACAGRGSIACERCAATGKRRCSDCDGKGSGALACLACQKDGTRPCTGCFLGAYAAWELAADVLEKGGDPGGAGAWLALAQKRVDSCFALRERDLATTPQEVTAAKQARLRERERLAKRVEALRAPAPR